MASVQWWLIVVNYVQLILQKCSLSLCICVVFYFVTSKKVSLICSSVLPPFRISESSWKDNFCLFLFLISESSWEEKFCLTQFFSLTYPRRECCSKYGCMFKMDQKGRNDFFDTLSRSVCSAALWANPWSMSAERHHIRETPQQRDTTCENQCGVNFGLEEVWCNAQ